MRIRALPKTTVLNVEEIVSVLRSNTGWDRNKWMFRDDHKFLDGVPNPFNKIALASFPAVENGTKAVSTYLEMLTGV